MGDNYKPEYDLIVTFEKLGTRLNKVACKPVVLLRMIRLRRIQKRMDAIERLMKLELGRKFD